MILKFIQKWQDLRIVQTILKKKNEVGGLSLPSLLSRYTGQDFGTSIQELTQSNRKS
jgi:hypothetical protein